MCWYYIELRINTIQIEMFENSENELLVLMDAVARWWNRFKNDGFCIKHDEFCIKMMNFVFKMMKVARNGWLCIKHGRLWSRGYLVQAHVAVKNMPVRMNIHHFEYAGHDFEKAFHDFEYNFHDFEW